jgi:hypothetical protein
LWSSKTRYRSPGALVVRDRSREPRFLAIVQVVFDREPLLKLLHFVSQHVGVGGKRFVVRFLFLSFLLCPLVEMSGALDVMTKFLSEVDKEPPQDATFIKEMAEYLLARHVRMPSDLEGGSVSMFSDPPNGGKHTFLVRAFRYADKEYGVAPCREEDNIAAAVSAAVSSSISALVPKASESSAAKPVKKAHAHVDVSTRLPLITLAKLGIASRPSEKLIDELASEIATQKAKKPPILNPFISVDLYKYLPLWASSGLSRDSLDADQEEPSADAKHIALSLGGVKQDRKHLTMQQWDAAFDLFQVVFL